MKGDRQGAVPLDTVCAFLWSKSHVSAIGRASAGSSDPLDERRIQDLEALTIGAMQARLSVM